MKITLKLVLLGFLSAACFAQVSPHYNEGMEALQKNNITRVKICFKESVGKYRDAASFNIPDNLKLLIKRMETIK